MQPLRDLLYKIEGKGQWTLANNIGGKVLPPLSAVRRKKKGPNSESIGSIATAQDEVDSIVRQAYDEVYKGNLVDIEAATNKYVEDYGPYIYNGIEASMARMAGDHRKEMATNATESACGSDQWAPGDSRLLSNLAFEHLAELLNSIE